MNKNRFAKLALVVVALLAACNREPQPSVSPVGSWQDTLTTTTDGSGTQAFTAEISELESEDADYAGVFTVGDKVYSVTGFYNGTNDEGEIFIFKIPLDELQPTVSPIRFDGMMWSGPMTENTYSGAGSSATKRRTAILLESLNSSAAPEPRRC